MRRGRVSVRTQQAYPHTSGEFCVFCRILRQAPDERADFDTVLLANDSASVLPGLGAQAEGYLMVVPHAHILSCGSLEPQAAAAFFRTVDNVTRIMRQQYGPCVVFEHGACGNDNRAGSCVDHAHIHILPTQAPVAQLAAEERPFVRVPDWTSLEDWKERPYLAIRDQASSLWVNDGAGAPGQFFRRIAGRALGRPFEWDFHVSPNFDAARATARSAGALLRHGALVADHVVAAEAL